MKRISTYISLPAVAILLATGAAGFALSSCSDESMDAPVSSGKIIRFSPEISSVWKKATTTRGASYSNSLPTLSLSGGDKPLYLVPASSGEAVSNDTRGSQVTTETISSFGVFASIAGSGSGPDYMCNEEVTSDNGWQPVKEYMWPGSGALHINAYSPYAEAAAATEGIVSLPSSSDKDGLMLGYVVPADVKDQIDLLWSDPREASASPCDLSFNHALTSIRFAAGSELTPCTIKEIMIKGVKDSGFLNLESGEWTDIEGTASYKLTLSLSLSAGEGSGYVAAGTPVTDGDNTLFLLPQELGADAAISITVETDGKDIVLTAPLDGQEWEAGRNIIYRISANPSADSLRLDITGDLSTNYTGGTDNFVVTSSYSNGTESLPVKWKAEFVDDAGNVIEQPVWISSFPMQGDGDTDATALTTMNDIVFDMISAQTQILQDAADINQTSGNTPYNLASSTGSSAVENTANTYVINAPGKYSLPLVYGNSVKNGAKNSQAYTSTSHNTHALKGFVNHLGNAITDPYIYNNSGCEPADAVLIWEDELNLVRDVSLAQDGKSVEFNIPHNTIRQGNALIAVRDKDENIMWSWQLWVTDYKAGTSTDAITYSGKTYNLYPRCVGEVIGGDVTTFSPCSVKVRFTQTDVPDGLEPLQKTVEFKQKGITISTPDCYTYYQWGRKDPMMSSVKQWYDADKQEITKIPLESVSSKPAGQTYEQCWILTPQTFWESDHNYAFSYNNLWNSNLSSSAYVKTIYDPSPAGSMIPNATFLRGAIQGASVKIENTGSDARRAGFYVTLKDGTELYFPALGYRSGSSGIATDQGAIGEYWSSDALTSRIESRALVLNSTNGAVSVDINQEPRGHAFGVRPILE